MAQINLKKVDGANNAPVGKLGIFVTPDNDAKLIDENGAVYTFGGGASTFLALEDVPNSYVGQAGKIPIVKGEEDGLEFITQQSIGSKDYTNIKNFGALGDGVQDDTVFIQDALNAAASVGKWAFFPFGNYRITAPLNLPQGTKITGYGARIFSTSHIYMLNVESDTIIKGIEIEGTFAGTPDDLGRGINIVGTVNSYKSNISIEDCYINNMRFYGIYYQFVRDISIKNTKVFSVGYTGIMGLSVTNAIVTECHVKDIDYLEGGYGISFTRETVQDTLEANPRSVNCTVENCLVENNLQWKAYDSHGGDNISFINNRAVNCRQGIGLVASGNFASRNCKVINNYLSSNRGTIPLTGGAYGIAIAGVVDDNDLSTSVDFAYNNTVIGNIIIGYGMEDNANEGAIRFRNSINTIVSGNTIDKAILNAILIQNTNYNFSVTNNSIEDPNTSNAGLNAIGVQVSSEYNTGTIMGNVMYLRNPSLNTKVGDRGINVATASNNTLIIRNNPNNFILNTNIPLSVDIIQDNYHNATLRINKVPSSSNQQILFNEGFSFYSDDDGGQNVGDPVAFWLTGRPNTTVYVSPRSGGPFEWLGINANTVDIAGGILRLANAATLEPTGSTLNIDGTAGSGNAFKNGLHYTTISAGLANNYPENTGLSFVVKSDNTRIIEYFSNTTGTLYYRSLTTSSDNVWKRVLVEGEGGGVQTIVAGTNIVVDNLDPLNPVISAIPSSSAGILQRVYFTGEPLVLPSGTYYRTLIDGKGSVLSVQQTVTVDDDQKAFFTNDLIGPSAFGDYTIPIGSFTSFLTVSSNSSNGLKSFDIEVYISDVDGVPINNPDINAPVGDLGVRVIAILNSGNVTINANQVMQIPLSGEVISPVNILETQRIRYHISGEKVGTAGASIGISVYFGSDHNSYLGSPVPVNTSTVNNRSIVEGATATDALNSLQGQIEAAIIESNTVLFNKDYIIGNAAPRTGNILFDFTGAKLGATTEMRHNSAGAFTFPTEAMLMFDSAQISTTVDNYFMFVLTNKASGSERVRVYHALEGGI